MNIRGETPKVVYAAKSTNKHVINEFDVQVTCIVIYSYNKTNNMQ